MSPYSDADLSPEKAFRRGVGYAAFARWTNEQLAARKAIGIEVTVDDKKTLMKDWRDLPDEEKDEYRRETWHLLRTFLATNSPKDKS